MRSPVFVAVASVVMIACGSTSPQGSVTAAGRISTPETSASPASAGPVSTPETSASPASAGPVSTPETSASPAAPTAGFSCPQPATSLKSPAPQIVSGTYGLFLSPSGGLFGSPSGQNGATNLELIKPDATIAASVCIKLTSLSPQACGQGPAAWLQPPVSATNDEIYYRDGDTNIRMLVPPTSSLEVTSVPGNANVVS